MSWVGILRRPVLVEVCENRRRVILEIRLSRSRNTLKRDYNWAVWWRSDLAEVGKSRKRGILEVRLRRNTLEAGYNWAVWWRSDLVVLVEVCTTLKNGCWFGEERTSTCRLVLLNL